MPDPCQLRHFQKERSPERYQYCHTQRALKIVAQIHSQGHEHQHVPDHLKKCETSDNIPDGRLEHCMPYFCDKVQRVQLWYCIAMIVFAKPWHHGWQGPES